MSIIADVDAVPGVAQAGRAAGIPQPSPTFPHFHAPKVSFKAGALQRGEVLRRLTLLEFSDLMLVHDGGNPPAVYGNSLDPTLARDRQIPALHGENWL